MIPPSDKYVTAVKFHNITQGQGIAPHCRCGDPAVVAVFDVCCNVPMFKCTPCLRGLAVEVAKRLGDPTGCVECGRVAPLSFDLYRLEEL